MLFFSSCDLYDLYFSNPFSLSTELDVLLGRSPGTTSNFMVLCLSVYKISTLVVCV